MTRLRQTIARRLKESQNTAAQLTTFNEVDMTEVMALRSQYKEVFEKRHGVKLGFMSFFTRAVVQALHEIPAVNAEIDGTDIIYKNHYDIGIAVGTDKGLVVPVLRDADALSLAGIAGAWSPAWLVWQLPGAVVFLVAGVAELQRPPFDMPVADSEIVFGAYTEYTGLRFAFFLLSEYAGIVVMSLLFAVLYLGGWQGPFSDQLGWLWTLLKGFVVAVFVIWLRVAWPRLREDQLQRLAWLVLVPLALVQLGITGVWVVVTA